MIEFSVSVLCFNKPGITRYCLSSILRHSPPNPRVCEILVTDNGSAEETAAIIDRAAKRDRRVRVLRHEQNLGVVRAKNIAFEQARGRYFASLDNDTHAGRLYLQRLREPMLGDELVAQVGRKRGFSTLTKAGIGVRGAKLDYIDGSCFLVRTEVARRLGLCDEAYEFAYCEDSDFSLRLRKAGWRIALAAAGVYHAEHSTASGMQLARYWKRNHKLFLARWSGYLGDRRFGHAGEPGIPQGAGPPAASAATT